MTAREHIAAAEALLAQLDTTGTPEQLAGVCHALVALYWQREGQDAEQAAFWRAQAQRGD
jgi:hypothetical protein